jgi:hypothetical protein
MDATIFNRNSFLDTLSQAKKQLPLDGSSIILIKVPNSWKNNEPELMEASQNMVYKTKRPLGVVCWREEWVRISIDQYQKFTRGFEVFNDHWNDLKEYFLPFLPLAPIDSNWTEFGRFSEFIAMKHKNKLHKQ